MIINQKIICYNTFVKDMLKKMHISKIKNLKGGKLLNCELSFWSSFVNKNYSLVTTNDERILRKEIELVSEYELEQCRILYNIRKKL